MVNIIEKPWARGSDLAVFGLLRPHALGFLNYRQDGLCQWEGAHLFSLVVEGSVHQVLCGSQFPGSLFAGDLPLVYLTRATYHHVIW